MKKYKLVILIFLVMPITLIICMQIPKFKHIKFNQTREYIYYNSHKDEIDKIVLKTYTLLGEKCYLINNEIGKDFIENLKIKKEINYTITDSNASLYMYYNSSQIKQFNFESGNFKYENKKYEVNNDVYKLIDNNEIDCFN